MKTMNIEITEKRYITYEEPFVGHTFTFKQMHEVYRDLADKNEYHDFETWFTDMLKSGVFEEVKQTESMSRELKLLDDIEEVRQKAIENPKNYPTEYTVRLITAIVSEYVGYNSRVDWTDKLKEHPESKYATRLSENRFHI